MIYLLARGADPEAKTKDEKTPKNLAPPGGKISLVLDEKIRVKRGENFVGLEVAKKLKL